MSQLSLYEDACIIPERPDPITLDLIKELIPIKKLIAEYQFGEQTSAQAWYGGGGKKRGRSSSSSKEYTVSQKAIAHVLTLCFTLFASGVGVGGIYYVLYYSGLLAYFWPAMKTLDASVKGCGQIIGGTGRFILKKMTAGYVPSCKDVHTQLENFLDEIYGWMKTLGIPTLMAGGYSTVYGLLLSKLFDGSCPKKQQKTYTRSLYSSASSSAAAAGGGRPKRNATKNLK